MRSFGHLALLVAFLPAMGCSEEIVVGTSGTAVTIDGEKLSYSFFARHAEESLFQGSETETGVADGVMSALFDQYLDGQLLIRLAIERGLVDGEVDEERAIQYLLRDVPVEPSPDEIALYYRSRRGELEHPERVHLRQILVDDRDLARQAQEALLAGEDFSRVAARFSQGPTAHLGGDQGLLARADLPAKLVELIFSLEPGEASGIVDSDFGYQLFQVDERLPAQVVTLEEATPGIREDLLRRKVDEQVGSLLSEARERYRLVVYPNHIPFDYRGFYASDQEE